jgi:glycosyltransferase involved in cell wall biosynthesis
MKQTRCWLANVMVFESYAAGSHGRTIDLLKRHSRHWITDVRIHRDHWSWLALAGHHYLVEHARVASQMETPDLLIFSGAINIGSLVAMLPAAYQRAPRVAYFHESQWSYPSTDRDIRQYLVQHLDALAVCDEVWFNSKFHLDDFASSSVLSTVDDRLRRLARTLTNRHFAKMRVVYPPVDIGPGSVTARQRTSSPTLLWNARWENDKRPDRFIALVRHLATRGLRPSLRILGTAGRPVSEIEQSLSGLSQDIYVAGHLDSREQYEGALAGHGLFVSTADHEFFGVAAIESVMAGNLPVLPYKLAYPETLPSSWFYRHDDIDDLASTVVTAMSSGRFTMKAHQSDAGRFTASEIVPVWDECIDRVTHQSRLDG